MRTSFPNNYNVKAANEDNQILSAYLSNVYTHEFGITSEGGHFLVDSGLDMTLAKCIIVPVNL